MNFQFKIYFYFYWLIKKPEDWGDENENNGKKWHAFTSIVECLDLPKEHLLPNMDEDDDFLLEFGVPPDSFAVRPAIQSVIEEANELQVRDAIKASLPRARQNKDAFRCVVCTLPGGTCEHTDNWCVLQSNRLLDSTERSGIVSKSMDSVDAQLSDLVDVIGIASTNLPPTKPRRLTPNNHEGDNEDEEDREEYNDYEMEGRDRIQTETSNQSQFEDMEYNTGEALLRGERPLHQSMEPWEIACASGGTNKGLLPPPPLRTYRWTFPEQNAHDRIGSVNISNISLFIDIQYNFFSFFFYE